jgi:hypothetical protein
MKKELDFIDIEGCYGGDQHWYKDRFMRLAGCSAVCASEACAYLAGHFERLRALYPYDPAHIAKKEFVAFMTRVFSYVTPGLSGMSSIERFRRCFLNYADAAGTNTRLTLLDGRESVNDARKFAADALDEGYPVLYLLLRHQDPALDDFTWHWFNLTGYELNEGRMTVDFATWGKKHSVDFARLWNTGNRHKGGMVVVKEPF